MKLLLRWAISALGVWVAVRIIPGIRIEEGLGPLFAVALLLGGVNTIVRPALQFLACGHVLLSLGLFLLVINAAMLLLTAALAGALGVSFEVDGFWAALLGSLVVSLVSYLASLATEPSKRG